MGHRWRLLLTIALFSSTVVLYNNCNGIPYGGAVPTGKYFAANKVCGSGQQDYLQVEQVDGEIKGTYVIPCQNQIVDVNPWEVLLAIDEDIIVYNQMGFAHEDTERAKQIENYKVACRLTEQVGFNEYLVYGNKPNYTLERIIADPVVQVIRYAVAFSGILSTPYQFSGSGISLDLMPRESGNDFIGRINGQSPNMLCDNLSSESVSEW